MRRAAFSSAKSSMVTVPRSLRHVRTRSLRAVSKHALAPYRSGRSKTWLKCKCFTESTFVIIGTDRDRKTGALLALLAQADTRGLANAGSAFIALSGNEREA